MEDENMSNVINNLVMTRQKFLELRNSLRIAEEEFVSISKNCEKAEREFIEALEAFDKNFEVVQ
jgi:hypothetical protein